MARHASVGFFFVCFFLAQDLGEEHEHLSAQPDYGCSHKNPGKNRDQDLDPYRRHSDSPSCIDNIDAYIKIKNQRILDLKFSGIGCAICTSSTDIMTIILKNKTTKKAKEIIDNYNKMILGKKFDKTTLHELFFYRNVYKQSNRIKCALVGIQAIKNAIEKYEKSK